MFLGAYTLTTPIYPRDPNNNMYATFVVEGKRTEVHSRSRVTCTASPGIAPRDLSTEIGVGSYRSDESIRVDAKRRQWI